MHDCTSGEPPSRLASTFTDADSKPPTSPRGSHVNGSILTSLYTGGLDVVHGAAMRVGQVYLRE